MDAECMGDRTTCPDLVGAVVIERRVIDMQIREHCGLWSQACAKLNFTTGECVIYLPRRSTKELRRHERNHCRGWNHPEPDSKYWIPMPEAINE